MIWETPFVFEAKANKCVYSYVMEKLREYASETPDKKVLIAAENTSNYLTYAQLLDQVRAVEVFLDKIGFAKGQFATVYMPNNIEIIPFYLAVLGRGGIYTGISSAYTKYEVEYQLTDNGSTVVFTTETLLENVKYVAEKADRAINIIILEHMTPTAHQTTWSEVIKMKGEPLKQSNNIHDIAVLPYSSGTTGKPKGVKLSHYNLLSAVLSLVNHAIDQIPHPEKTESIWDCVQILSFPSFHISGKFIIFANIVAGSTTVVMSAFDLRVYLETIQNFKVWNLLLCPPLLQQLIKEPLVGEYDLSSLGYVTCGGAPLGAELAREFIKKFPNVLLTQIYGMSESINPFLVRCNKKENYVTLGCVSPGFQAKIVDVENGDELGIKANGELLIKGPTVMQGYLNNPETTKLSLDSEGWFHTGDICYMNEDGELFLVDRKKEIIKVYGSFSISPSEIENVLVADPRIKDVGVVGIPNNKGGEIPYAFVVKEDPELVHVDVEMIIKERLADWKWEKGRVVFIDEIPKLPSGKILRRRLREFIV